MTDQQTDLAKRRTSFWLPDELRTRIDRQRHSESRHLANMLVVLLERGLDISPTAEKGVLR